MLHKVNVPLCREHLLCIVDLQRQFLNKICCETTTVGMVDEDWLVAKMPHVSEQWLRAFCKVKDKVHKPGQPMLVYMKIIAGAGDSVKEVILSSFEHDIKLLEDVEQGNPVDHPFHGLTKIVDTIISDAVRCFLETFYDPQFYDNGGRGGYSVLDGAVTIRFHKDIYLTKFDAVNPDVAVCPVCDGDRNTAQVDHIYPKSLYPFLSCHPLNLVPICSRCNKFGAKANKPPLNHDDPDPMEKWFHPYFKPLLDWSKEEQHPDNMLFSVEFFRDGNKTVPHLTSQEPLIAERLVNLDDLVKLTREWKKVISQTIREQQRNIRRYKHKKPPYISEATLKDKMEEWQEDRRRGIGLDPNAILRSYYWAAVGENPVLFEELWVYYDQNTP